MWFLPLGCTARIAVTQPSSPPVSFTDPFVPPLPPARSLAVVPLAGRALSESPLCWVSQPITCCSVAVSLLRAAAVSHSSL